MPGPTVAVPDMIGVVCFGVVVGTPPIPQAKAVFLWELVHEAPWAVAGAAVLAVAATPATCTVGVGVARVGAVVVVYNPLRPQLPVSADTAAFARSTMDPGRLHGFSGPRVGLTPGSGRRYPVGSSIFVKHSPKSGENAASKSCGLVSTQPPLFCDVDDPILFPAANVEGDDREMVGKTPGLLSNTVAAAGASGGPIPHAKAVFL